MATGEFRAANMVFSKDDPLSGERTIRDAFIFPRSKGKGCITTIRPYFRRHGFFIAGKNNLVSDSYLLFILIYSLCCLITMTQRLVETQGRSSKYSIYEGVYIIVNLGFQQTHLHPNPKKWGIRDWRRRPCPLWVVARRKDRPGNV